MKEECGDSNIRNNLLMVEPPSADFLNEACFLRGQGNAKEFRMAMSNKGKKSLVREGFMYRLDHSGKDKLSWRCSTRGCPAHLKTDHLAEIIVQDNEKPHTHAVDASRFEKQLLRIACKRKAVEDCTTSAQDIISNEMTRLSGLNLNPKNTKFLQLAMYRERKKVFPKMPRVARSGKTLKQERKFNVHSDGVTSIPQPHIPTLSTAFYAQPQSTTYQPHFDMLTEEGGSDYHHPHHNHDDNTLRPLPRLLHQQEHSEPPPRTHQHQILHHQLQPLESTLPQTIFPSNHLLPGPVGVASTSEEETTSVHHLSSCAVRKKICHSDIRVHEELLNDKVCTLAYRRALQENRERLKGATVLEVGAGIGILSHFAIQAGATRVYAVESSGMAAFADRVAKENGIGSVLTVIQSKVETADIPVNVDAIIWTMFDTDRKQLGQNLLYDSMLPSLLIARNRFLKQGGEMYPCTASLYLAPINDDICQERLKSWKQMKNVYGVSMESLVNLAKDALTARADRRYLEVESVLANACQVCHFDLKTMTLQDAQLIKADFNFRCYSHSIMHGFATWFIVSFPGSVILDTSPYALRTHWGQTGMYLKTPVTVKQDSEIVGVFKMQPSPDNQKFWEIEIEFQINRGRKYTQQWQCVQ